MDREASGVDGQCHCGTVQIRLQFPTKFFAHCHCADCRVAHGAAFVSWVGVLSDQFTVVAGEDALQRYDSSEAAWRQFCNRCGTTLTFGGERWAGEVHVAAACLTGPVDRPPSAHAYFDRGVDWIVVGDDLPRYGGVGGTEPLE